MIGETRCETDVKYNYFGIITVSRVDTPTLGNTLKLHLMNLSDDVIAYLRDEAYAVLCKESLSEALTQIENEKEQIMTTRPPFMMLATKKTRHVFETSLRSALHTETELRSRLDQVEMLDRWLKENLEKALYEHLSALSPEFQRCNEAEQLIAKWEYTIEGLHEKCVALARDAKSVAGAASESSRGVRDTRKSAIGNLRNSVEIIQRDLLEVTAARTAFERLGAKQGTEPVQLPGPPAFRNSAWVEKISLLPDDQLFSEAQRLEVEARSFGNEGIAALLAKGNELRSACRAACQTILNDYWSKLRAYSQAHYVQERDVDEVIEELTKHYTDVAQRRRPQLNGAWAPFMNER